MSERGDRSTQRREESTQRTVTGLPLGMHGVVMSLVLVHAPTLYMQTMNEPMDLELLRGMLPQGFTFFLLRFRLSFI